MPLSNVGAFVDSLSGVAKLDGTMAVPEFELDKEDLFELDCDTDGPVLWRSETSLRWSREVNAWRL